MHVVLIVLELVAVVGNLAYWWWVVTRGLTWFRGRVERRYNVTITNGFRGAWNVAGEGSWLRRGAIGWLQLAYFMAAFVAWAIVLIGVVLVEQLAF